MRCPNCGSSEAKKNGKNKSDDSIQRWKCLRCGREFDDNTAFNPKAKVLLFDIETAPMEVYVWNLRNNNYIHITQIIKDWNIICWRAKWLFDDKIHGAVQTPAEARSRNDENVTKKLWELLDEADILIAHNLINFDLKKSNTKFIEHNIKPPSPFQMIDTLRIARKNFMFSSNKLDYLCQMLGIGAKLDTGFDLWKGCLAGDKESLNKMYDYCGQDVAILEDLYLKLRPYIKSHPNISLYRENTENACSNCGSKDISYCSKPYYTPTGQYQTFRCNNCGAIIRSRYSKKREKELLRSCAR